MSVRTIIKHGCPLTVQTLERVALARDNSWGHS